MAYGKCEDIQQWKYWTTTYNEKKIYTQISQK